MSVNAELFQSRNIKDLIFLFGAACEINSSVRFFSWGDMEDFDPRDNGTRNSYSQILSYYNLYPLGQGATFSVTPNPETLYPYVFLNPTGLTIIQGYYQFNCNLVVVEQPITQTRDDILDSQESTLNILQDILAFIKMSSWKNSPRQGVTSAPNPVWAYRGSGSSLKLQTDAYLEYPISVIPYIDWANMGVVGYSCNFNINLRNPLDNSNAL